MSAVASTLEIPPRPWSARNADVVRLCLQRLRLLLERRVLWLRAQWRHDPVRNFQGLVIDDAEADWLLAPADLEAEAHFHVEDERAAGIGSALQAVEAELRSERAALVEMGQPCALDLLTRLFSLSAFEGDVLLLCLAPEVDPAFERLYAYVQDDVTRKYATPHLARTLLQGAGDGRETQHAFLADAPLRRFGLLSVEPGLPGGVFAARPLRLDDRIATYLQGINHLDERVAPLLRAGRPGVCAPETALRAGQLAALLQAIGPRRPWPVLNFVGPRGSGRRLVARALCERLGLHLYELDTRQLPERGPELDEHLRILEREAVLLQLAFLVEEEEEGGAETTRARDVLDRLGALVLVASLEPTSTHREAMVVPVDRPDADARRALWQEALGGGTAALEPLIDELAEQFELGPIEVLAAARAARELAALRAGVHDAVPEAADLRQACRRQSSARLDGVARKLSPGHGWDDIVLPEAVHRQLREIADQVSQRSRVYNSWGFAERLARGRGISALFSGSSGTGKTMAAEVLARALDLDLYRVDLAGVVSKYIGETEKNLRRVFDAAERSGAILFFDEADALFGKRTEVRDSHDRYANIEVNYLLQRMEDFRGLAILATNRKAALDRAFLRRLRFLVDFPMPDTIHRERIWRRVFPALTPTDGLDWPLLARLEIPGGNIRNVALNGAFLAAAEGGVVHMDHLMRAARREYAKIDKLMTAAEFGRYLPKESA